MQKLGLRQATSKNWIPPPGEVHVVQVVPPSVVLRMEGRFVATTHKAVFRQKTAFGVLLADACTVHVAPPSVVSRMALPLLRTAMHMVMLGQLTSWPATTCGCVQVAPPSFVV